jgi:hypothetical protein
MIGRISIFRVFSVLIALGTVGACLPDPGGLPSGSGGTGGGSGRGGSGTVSCGGSSGASALATWANVRSIIYPDFGGCYGSDCHTQGDREPFLLGLNSTPLDDAVLYDKLTTYKTMKCGKRVLVKPCAPDESAFYLAQVGTCPELPQMPFGCLPENDNCTPADKLEGLRQWIANGAPRP